MAQTKIKPGVKAPDFSLPTTSGGSVTLKDLLGKNSLLIFWKSTCPYCINEAPKLSAALKEVGDALKVTAIATGRDTAEDADRFAKEHGFPFTVAVDESKSARTAYGLRIVPTLFWLSPDGTVQAVYEGSSAGLQEAVERAVEAVKKGEAVPSYDVVGSG
ncbi:MAG: TlpA family protein disulfide reductase [Armatimonadetes bacterium]|nr:TlpA family protein disulfide reductase [Armatimonadota bacterium]MDW8121445.1 TlpA disulfide reductase family protein [Armatimonadota bacterium]